MAYPEFAAPNREDWDEHEWEQFLQRADVRTAKYQELFETLSDRPDRDAIIAREMGWNHFFESCPVAGKVCDTCAERDDCEPYALTRLLEGMEDDEATDEFDEDFEQIQSIPAFQKGEAFLLRLEQFCRSAVRDEDVVSAVAAAGRVPAQIAGGHGMGYERESLCGNIANCKRALKNAVLCRALLADLGRRGVIAEAQAEGLQAEADRLCEAVKRWIEDLRSRVWWL